VTQQQTQQPDATVNAEQPENIENPTVSSDASSGERSPHFYLQNDPEKKQFLAPTKGQRRDFYDHGNGRWKFAMTLDQTRLDGSGADDRRFHKGTMPRKSVFLCVRANEAGVIEDVSQPWQVHLDKFSNPSAANHR
jgi:hypothetical protein